MKSPTHLLGRCLDHVYFLSPDKYSNQTEVKVLQFGPFFTDHDMLVIQIPHNTTVKLEAFMLVLHLSTFVRENVTSKCTKEIFYYFFTSNNSFLYCQDLKFHNLAISYFLNLLNSNIIFDFYFQSLISFFLFLQTLFSFLQALLVEKGLTVC